MVVRNTIATYIELVKLGIGVEFRHVKELFVASQTAILLNAVTFLIQVLSRRSFKLADRQILLRP